MKKPRKHRTAYRKMMGGDPTNKEPMGLYRTPAVAPRKLMEREKIPGPAWECACGDGRISQVLRNAGIKVHSTDLHDYKFGRSGVDFTKRPSVRFKFRTIITNPPFKLAHQFAETALSYKPDKVCLLLRLMWLEGQKRAEFFKRTHLARVYVFPRRIGIHRANWRNKKAESEFGGMVPYAWFVWRRGYRGPTIVEWLT